MDTYSIVRFFQAPWKTSEVVKTGMTLRGAQRHVVHPESSSTSASSSDALRRTALFGTWSDGYVRERTGAINGLAEKMTEKIEAPKIYPDTYEGVLQMLKDEFSVEVPDSCLAQKDDRLDGVWLLMHPNGAECLAFLAGESREDRDGNDAEFTPDWPTVAEGE